MEKIKLTNNKVTLKDGKVSCECCGACSYGCSVDIEFQYVFLPPVNATPTLPPITSPYYYLGRDFRFPVSNIGIDIEDYPPEWGLILTGGGAVQNPNRPIGDRNVYPHGPQGTDYSIGRPKNCDLCIYNILTNLWDY